MNLPENHIDSLKQLCALHRVDRKYLFGSALRENFKSDRDFNFLVKFKPIELAAYFDNYTAFRGKLQELLGCNVDPLEKQALKNQILIRSINKTKRLFVDESILNGCMMLSWLLRK
jgi:predicted nucleotidyltransferase